MLKRVQYLCARKAPIHTVSTNKRWFHISAQRQICTPPEGRPKQQQTFARASESVNRAQSQQLGVDNNSISAADSLSTQFNYCLLRTVLERL